MIRTKWTMTDALSRSLWFVELWISSDTLLRRSCSGDAHTVSMVSNKESSCTERAASRQFRLL